MASIARPLVDGMSARLTGPGGFYTIGNLIGLAAGLIFADMGGSLSGGRTADMSASIADYLAGSASSLAVWFASVAFFVAGEIYHRAYRGRARPDPRQIQRADVCSGLGAAALSLGFYASGNLLLALMSGLLHAGGKFGSALALRSAFSRRAAALLLGEFCRYAVLASRLAAVLIIVWKANHVQDDLSFDAFILCIALIACYAMWSIADIILLD